MSPLQLTIQSRSLAVLRNCLAALCLVAASAQAQQPVVPQNVVQLSASGSLEVQQDLLAISMTATREAAEPGPLQTLLKQLLDTALAEARKTAQNGAMDVRTGVFNLSPRYGRDGKISAWQGTVELVLEGRDFPRISTAAGRVPGLTIGNVSFALSREQRLKVEADAQAMAIERFKAKAAEVSKAFGFSGYSLREVSVSSSDQGFVPRNQVLALQAKSAMADAAVPVEAGKSTVLVNVSGSVQLK